VKGQGGATQVLGVRGSYAYIKGNKIYNSIIFINIIYLLIFLILQAYQYGAKVVALTIQSAPNATNWGTFNVFDGNYINIPPPAGSTLVFAGICIFSFPHPSLPPFLLFFFDFNRH
jgi:hypothetical protein